MRCGSHCSIGNNLHTACENEMVMLEDLITPQLSKPTGISGIVLLFSSVWPGHLRMQITFSLPVLNQRCINNLASRGKNSPGFGGSHSRLPRRGSSPESTCASRGERHYTMQLGKRHSFGAKKQCRKVEPQLKKIEKCIKEFFVSVIV